MIQIIELFERLGRQGFTDAPRVFTRCPQTGQHRTVVLAIERQELHDILTGCLAVLLLEELVYRFLLQEKEYDLR